MGGKQPTRVGLRPENANRHLRQFALDSEPISYRVTKPKPVDPLTVAERRSKAKVSKLERMRDLTVRMVQQVDL
jgi:hypothetical protein